MCKKTTLIRKYIINENIFDNLSQEDMYWLGFISSDGYVKSKKDKTNRIKLELQSGDQDHIDKFIKFVGTNKKPSIIIRNDKKNNKIYSICKIEIFSAKIIEKLYTLGIRSPKYLLNIKEEKILKSIDFWRGYIDGNGCWTPNKQKSHNGSKYYYFPNLAVVSPTLYIIEKFKEFVESKIGKLQSSILKEKNENCYRLNIHGKKALFLRDILYYDKCISLSRKEKQAKKYTL
jgi:hypothetical protein